MGLAGISAARRASIRDAVSRRSAACRKVRRQARWPAFTDLMETARLGTYALIDVDIDCEVITRRGSMLVSITGTARRRPVDQRAGRPQRRVFG